MKFPSKLFSRRRREGTVLLALVLSGPAIGCGPDFPNSYFDLPASALLAAPEGFFAAEIARLTATMKPAHRAASGGDTAEMDLADLRRALAERGVEQRNADRIAMNYGIARRALDHGGADPLHEEFDTPAVKVELLANAPAEFAHYLRGAVAWRRGELATARDEWNAVLALPAAERRYRSTWAAFMVGRAWLREAETGVTPGARSEAALAFRRVREFAAAGLPDPLGMAAASYGWEARAALGGGDYASATRLYLEQYVTGDPTALESLRRTAARMASLPDNRLPAIAADDTTRPVLTAYFVSRGGPHFDDEGLPESLTARCKAWAEALNRARMHAVPEADRLAWLAYEAGLFPLAQQWVALAADTAPEAQWIRAKLALRDGDLQRGRQWLNAALAGPGVADAHRRRIAAELGRVCLALDDFDGALTAWLAGGHWEDAAYTAERVMTLAELRKFVDAHCPPETRATMVAPRWWQPQEDRQRLRQLLGRRMMRAGKVEAAEDYFPPDLRSAVHGYGVEVRAGFDQLRPAAERAAAFWRAAQTVHAHGMELLGTELEPDWAIYDGDFDFDATTAARRRAPVLAGNVFAPTPVESKRLDGQPAPEKRFHYRYRAAELAAWAAALLPNDAEETARILYTAGSWLKNRDPQAAQPFYQALVIRCGQTELGRAARQLHWFPPPPGKPSEL